VLIAMKRVLRSSTSAQISYYSTADQKYIKEMEPVEERLQISERSKLKRQI